MLVWRLVQKQFYERCLTGDGAKNQGGRWNQPGFEVVYASQSRALAAMEILVNINRRLLTVEYVFVPIQIPNKTPLQTLAENDLPKNWRKTPAPVSLQELGTRWLEKQSSAVLAVPSAVLPYEKNYLLNPRHPDFKQFTMGQTESYYLMAV